MKFHSLLFSVKQKACNSRKSTFETTTTKLQNSETKSMEDSNTFEELHDVGAKSGTFYLEALKSCTLCECLEFLRGPLFPTRVVSQHDAIDMDNQLRGKSRIGVLGKNAFGNNHFPIDWQSFIAILQKLGAVCVAPVMTYPLHKHIHVKNIT